MKSLRPVVILTAGPGLLAVGCAVGSWLALPDLRTVSGVGRSLLAGALLGVVIFAPIAAASVLRRRHPDWLLRHSFRIHWYTSMAMVLALGYLIACVRHGVFDTLAGVALVVVFFGAVTKIALSEGV